MVDLQNKIVYFGYGDVAVYSNGSGYMRFTNIKPPCECGECLNDKDIEYGEQLIVEEEQVHDLYRLFTTVSKENLIVTYKNITFDFTNYNQKSVEVCIKKGLNTVNIKLLAC